MGKEKTSSKSKKLLFGWFAVSHAPTKAVGCCLEQVPPKLCEASYLSLQKATLGTGSRLPRTTSPFSGMVLCCFSH